MVKQTHSLKVSRKLWNQIWSPGRYKSLLTLQAVLPLTRMGAVRRLVLLALLIVPCLAELNSTESEGKSSCQASVGGSSQSDAHRALILQLNPNEDCTWTLERPENKSIRLIFSHFQLDPDGGCESEHIQVFEGNSTKGPLLGKFCSKHDYIPVFQSSSNTLTIQIVTDSVRIQRTVFIFYYFFSPGTSPRFHCNAKQNAKKFCKWIPEQSSTLVCFLRPRADHVTLLLNHTNLQSGTVQVLQSQTQATFSGLTSGHYLTAIPDCGGYLDSLEGSFTSPNYPNPHPELAYCVWHIQVEKGYKIKLNFKDIFLETDEHCRFDFIAVYDGSSTTSGLIGQVCGYAKPTFESSSDSLTVVLSTDYANSYRGFSASYTSIYAENINTTSLICSSDRMRAIISKSYLASFKYNENDLQLNDPTCRPKISNVVEFSIPLDGCGTIKKVEDYSVTYTNIIILIPSPTSEVITRQKHLQIILKCEMESNSTVEMMYITEDDVIQNQSGVGKYNTSMALFESNSFEKPILESPYYVDLNQTLFVQVSLRTSDPNLVVFLDTCIASPTPDFASPTYDLIRSGCNQDETCKVYPLSGHYGRFQFDAFKFLRSLGSVYLQCKILICDSSDEQSRCNQGCVSRRKRDISSYKWKTDSVIGPIRLKKDRSASGNPGFQDQIHREETQNQPFDSLHLFSFMALALNVVIVAALIARRFVNQRADYKYQKLQNIN